MSEKVEVTYQPGMACLGLRPAWVWRCPRCGERFRMPISKHPDTHASQRLKAQIEEHPVCVVCGMDVKEEEGE